MEETPRQEKKTSAAAAAIESKGEDIILGAIEFGKIIFEPLDIAKGYHAISFDDENYVYFRTVSTMRTKTRAKATAITTSKLRCKMKRSRM